MAAGSRLRHLVRWVLRYRAVLYLLLALAAIDIVVRAHARRWRAYDPVFYRERLEACRRGKWDLVVVGGSPTMSGIDVGVLAGVPWQGRPLERAFNLGLPLGTTAEVYHAVEHGVARPPRLLLYGIAATDLNDNRLEPNGPRLLMNGRDLLRWTRARPDAAPWGLWHHTLERVSALWSLSHYREGIRLWVADKVGTRWPGLCPEAVALAHLNRARAAILQSERGFVASGLVTPATRLDCLKAAHQPMPFTYLRHYRVNGYLRYLQRLFDWADRHAVPLVLVNMPVSADLEERMYPQEFAAYRSVLKEAAAARGVRVLWPSRAEVGLTDAHFADWIHLNADGAARLSIWIRRAISSSEE